MQQMLIAIASSLEVHDGYKQATWRHTKSWSTAVVSCAIAKVVEAACRYERTLDERLADRLILCHLLLDTGGISAHQSFRSQTYNDADKSHFRVEPLLSLC